jgi:periplasmic glucans biosynthesis protein
VKGFGPRLHGPCTILFALTALVGTGPAHAAFGFADVAQRALALSASSYEAPEKPPKDLADLTYDQYRDIRFRPDRAWWRSTKLPFELQFFHTGFNYGAAVRINEVTPGGVQEIRFSPAQFDYGHNTLDPGKLRGGGFAGFRVHYPLNAPQYKDEVLVFLGASYFRALGKHQRYGLSARGLAVDTALLSGEEFPRFREFWIERPDPQAKELRILALLDSPRVTGAYRFILIPGANTAIEVHARVYLRENITKLALAPLTSMYFHGENQPPPREDYRPEVHDSDGLAIQSGTGEWIWRPLVDPKRLLVTSFAMNNPQGFGLQQRDRDFASYEDLEAHYEMRPSAWVAPRGNWGAGRVELVQIPTPDETNDNIVAYWVPSEPPGPRQPYEFEYVLSWQRDSESRPPLSWVTQTRRGYGPARKADESIQYHLDFDGPALHKLDAAAKIEGVVTADANAQQIVTNLYHNDVTGGYRLALQFKRVDEKKPVEIRAYLRNGTNVLSETWSYVLPPI